MSSRTAPNPWGTIRDGCAREALACVLASPRDGFADAYAAGCRVGMFAQPHHVALWMALAGLAHHERLTGEREPDRRAAVGLALRLTAGAGVDSPDRDDELLAIGWGWFEYRRAWVAGLVRRLATVAADATELTALERRAAELRDRLTSRAA